MLYQVRHNKTIGYYIQSGNPLYLIIGEVDGYIEESNGDKHLIFASTNKSKEVLIKCTELWDRIKYLIEKIEDRLGEYDTFPIECIC